MAIKSKYCNRSRLSNSKFRSLVRFFSLDIEAKKTAALIRLNRNTVNRYYQLLRRCIALYCLKDCSPSEQSSAAEVKNSDACLMKETIVNGGSKYFGIWLINGKICTEILSEEYEPVARFLIGRPNGLDESAVDWKYWGRYVGIVDLRAGRHFRVGANAASLRHSNRAFKTSELFWGYAKTRLLKFNGLRKSTLPLHLKECEFRFNHRGEDLYDLLLNIIRSDAPIN